MGRYVFILAVALVALTPVIHAVAQMMPSMQQIMINVEEAELKLIVHEDGAVEPKYNLRAIVQLPQNTRVDGIFEAYYTSTVESKEAVYELVATGELVFKQLRQREMPMHTQMTPSTTSVNLVFKLSAEATVDQGNILFNVNGRIDYETPNKTGWVKIEKFMVNVVDGSKGVLEAKIALYPPEEQQEQPQLNITEIMKSLEEAGITFIRIEEVGGGVRASGEAYAFVKTIIDINDMIEYALAKGLSPSDADNVRKLLNADVKVESKSSLDGKLKIDGTEDEGSLSVDVKLYSQVTGDINELDKLLSMYGDSISKLIMVVVMGLMMDLGPEAGQPAPLMPMMGFTAGEQPLLMVKPVSEESLKLRIVGEGDSLRIEVSYDGPRLVFTLATGEPSRDAEKTLAEIANMLDQYRQLSSTLAFMVPGFEQLLPDTIVLEPAKPTVSISMEKASIRELRAVTVTVKPPKPVEQTEVKTETRVTETKEKETPTETPRETTTAITQTQTLLPPSPTSPAKETTTTTIKKEVEGMDTMLLMGVVVVAILAIIALVIVLLRRR